MSLGRSIAQRERRIRLYAAVLVEALRGDLHSALALRPRSVVVRLPDESLASGRVPLRGADDRRGAPGRDQGYPGVVVQRGAAAGGSEDDRIRGSLARKEDTPGHTGRGGGAGDVRGSFVVPAERVRLEQLLRAPGQRELAVGRHAVLVEATDGDGHGPRRARGALAQAVDE